MAVEIDVPKVGNVIKSNVRRFLLGRNLPESWFEDVCQHAWTEVMKAVPRYDPGQKTSFETYIGYRIRGACMDFFRQYEGLRRKHPGFVRVHPSTNPECDMDSLPDPSNAIRDWEENHDIVVLIDRMMTCRFISHHKVTFRRDMAEVIRLRALGKNQKEIAMTIGVCPAWVAALELTIRENWKHLNNGCCKKEEA